MLIDISKSARYFAIACCFSGINGCASDGGLGELATMGAIAGSMMPGVDSGTVAALGTVAVATMVVVPVISDDSETDPSPSSPSSPSVAPEILAPVPTASRSQAADNLGLTLESLSPELVKALGLNDTNGAWVVSVTPDSPAAKAGIKPMDVIQDLSGQLINEPSDFMAIAGKLRSGYKAPLSVWRNRVNHELILAIPAGISAQAVTSSPAMHARLIAKEEIAAPASAKSTDPTILEFCYVYLMSNDYQKNPDALSTVFNDPSTNASSQQLIEITKKFVQKVAVQQPGVWQTFDYKRESCSPAVGVCSAWVDPFGGPRQSVMLRCFSSLSEANKEQSEDRLLDPTARIVIYP